MRSGISPQNAPQYTPAMLAQHNARQARLQRFSLAAHRAPTVKVAPPPPAPVASEPEPATVPALQRREYEVASRLYVNAPLASRIIRAIAREFDMTVDEMTGPVRDHIHVVARYVAIGLMVEMTKMSLPAIGRRLGGRDHTTILAGNRRASELFAEEAFRNRVDQLKSEIGT